MLDTFAAGYRLHEVADLHLVSLEDCEQTLRKHIETAQESAEEQIQDLKVEVEGLKESVETAEKEVEQERERAEEYAGAVEEAVTEVEELRKVALDLETTRWSAVSSQAVELATEIRAIVERLEEAGKVLLEGSGDPADLQRRARFLKTAAKAAETRAKAAKNAAKSRKAK